MEVDHAPEVAVQTLQSNFEHTYLGRNRPGTVVEAVILQVGPGSTSNVTVVDLLL